MITDYDCWKIDEAHVTVEMVINNLNRNAATAQAVLADVLPRIPVEPADWPCHAALKCDYDRSEMLAAKTKKALEPILKKYL